MFLRGAILRWQYKYYRGSWPLFEERIKTPEDWPGWPDGKEFAFVSTHDVETKEGQSRCIELMNLEQELGFVSSFNFVPERYEVSVELRDHLMHHGFEVGVHDLKHDGKLYQSRSKFQENAKSINRYLKEWGAVGFRSGAMHHNLEWIHALDIEYDASTFDFDPFEPQPDGMGTIFPFWVQSDPDRKGYVELPYTLPQDFTLFVMLRENSIDLWKRKLDWVASKGGMCLLITHPDYMTFGGKKRKFDEYPAAYYRELLVYVKERYGDRFWNVNPCQVTRYFKKIRVAEQGAVGR
ncbi:MAG: hypothetical protein Kow00128_11940 [Deltaproteobacteria bacterium]